MIAYVTKDTRLCISLAGRPSNIGTRFHNYLYDALGLDYLYKAFTTDDLAGAVAGIRALGIRGCGVSMPYKEDVLQYVDHVDPSAARIGSVNTLVNDDGRLTAYNTDYLALAALLREHAVPVDRGVVVLGSGGMAKAVVAAVTDAGASAVVVAARNTVAGPDLAQRFGARWQPEWDGSSAGAVLVNATPVGMAGGADADRMPVPTEAVTGAAAVVEVVAVPARTPLLEAADRASVVTVTGSQIIATQAAEQFALYTGVRPDAALVEAAAAYSRGG